jgi:hypothetical protein
MNSFHRDGTFVRAPGVLVALAIAVLAGATGCSGSTTPDGLGTTDAGGGNDATAGDAGGGDAAGDATGDAAGNDSGYACPALGCLPSCPNGTLKDSHGCETCQCAPGDGGGTCTTDSDCPDGGLCGYLESAACAATGQCFPNPGGARCALASAMGCGCHGSAVSIDPSCVSGLPQGYNPQPVLHAWACTDAGGGCVSQRGGSCGGNTANPCTCASGLTCTPGDSGLPFGDVGGTCQ